MARTGPDFIIERHADANRMRPQTSIAFEHVSECYARDRRGDDDSGPHVLILDLWLDETIADLKNHDFIVEER